MIVIGYTKSGAVLISVDGVEFVVPDDPNNGDRQAIAQWEALGNVIPPYAGESSAPTITDYENAIQNLVDSTARERQFADGVSLASYVASTKPKWAAEAQAFVAWRDYVWTSAYAELEKVQSGQRPQPTVEQFLSEIVRIAWPSN